MNQSNGEPIKLPLKPLINPLTEQDKAALEQVIANLDLIEDLLCRAEQCGLDTTAHRNKHEMHKVIATRLHTHFFPQQLPAVSE